MSWTFNPPPGWPVPSGNWVPPPGWTPDPDWPPAPPGWEFWVHVDAPTKPSHPPRPGRPQPQPRSRLQSWSRSWSRSRLTVKFAVLAGVILLATGTGALVAYQQRYQLPENVRELVTTDSDFAGAARVAVARMGSDPVVLLDDSSRDTQVLDLATGEPLRSLEPALHEPFATGEASGRPVAVLPSASTMRQPGSGSRDRVHPIIVWDLTTAERLGAFTDHTESVSSIAAGDLAGTPIVVSVSEESRTLRVWDLATGEQIHRLYGMDEDQWLGDGLAVADTGGRTVMVVSSLPQDGGDSWGLDVWSLAPGEAPGFERRLSCPGGLNMAPSTVAVGTRDGTPVAVSGCDRVVMWDITTGQRIAQLDADLHRPPRAIALTELHGAPVAVIQTSGGSVLAWDLADPDRFRTQVTGHSGRVRSLDVATLDGETVVVSSGSEGRVHVWPLDLTGRVS